MAQLVDFHTHFFSRRFFETLAQASPIPGPADAKMETVANAAGVEIPPSDVAAHVARWTKELDEYGVGHAVTFASIPEEIDVVSEAITASSGRLSGFCISNPTYPEAAARLDAALGEGGYKGAIVFPAMHRFRLDGPEFAQLVRVLEEHRAIVVVHCGMLRIPLRDRFELPRKYDITLSNPLSLIPVADEHPEVRFVIPHFGAGFLRETLIAGAQCSNVYVDTSSTHGWIAVEPQRLSLSDVFERALEVFGTERILFGTDSSTFPRGWRHDILLAQREALGACGVSSRDKSRILGENAERLLGLDA